MPPTRLEEKAMNTSPRQRDDYSGRQIEAARRVLLDVGQILSSFRDSMVVVGGWVPDLLLAGTAEIHVGSIDVDIALDARKLERGLYANLLALLLETRRFERGDKEFRFVSKVDLDDGMDAVAVEVDFLAASDLKIKGKNKLPGFRVLQADACEFAFRAPVGITLSGTTPSGAQNSVRLRVVSLPDFLVMKAHALSGRNKPKDAYDICFCLDNSEISELAKPWRNSRRKHIKKALEILREKFATKDSYGPMQVVEFHSPPSADERALIARRAFELVHAFLRECER
jgi:hypothetical protein